MIGGDNVWQNNYGTAWLNLTFAHVLYVCTQEICNGTREFL